MNPQEVMDRLAQRYASCSVYSDCGSVCSFDDNVERTDQRRFVFRTFFERPMKFRFEWKQEMPIKSPVERNFNIVWCDGSQTASFYDFEPGPTIEDNLVYAIAGATGISMGSAFEVPSLLIPEIREESNHMLLLEDLRLSESETIGEHDCFQILGSSYRSSDTILWISKADYSLRKMQEFSVVTAAESAKYAAERRAEFGDEFGGQIDGEHIDRSFCTVLIYETVLFDADMCVGIFNYVPTSADHV